MNKQIEEYLKQPWKEKVHYTCEKCGREVTRSGASFHNRPHLLCKACYMTQKYGVPGNILTKEAQQKKKDTLTKKYGGNSAFTDPKVRQKAKNTLKEKTGVDNPFKMKNFQEIKKKTRLEKYGVEVPIHNPEIQTKILETNRRNHNGLHNFQTQESKDKAKQTCLEKYGCEKYSCTPEYHKKAHRGYFYKNEFFDSSWELAYWIYCQDNKIDLARNKTPHKLADGSDVYFDFISNGRYVEIKGDWLKTQPNWELKAEAYLKYDVKVMFQKDMEPILKYIYQKYGRNFLKKFRNKKPGDFKRKIIEYDEITEEKFKQYKHRNVKYHYICNNCGKDVYTTWYIVDHHRDHLCKYCRKNKNTNYKE